MTRINTIDPNLLSKDHAFAEWREMSRPCGLVLDRIEKGQTASDVKIPEAYVLNAGHVTFFFDKIEFLHKRYIAICDICINKFGFNLNPEIIKTNIERYELIRDQHSEWYNDYEPTIEDHYLNMARLAKRSTMTHVLEECERIDGKYRSDVKKHLNKDI